MQQSQNRDAPSHARPERQEFHRSNTAMGISHILKLAGSLSPLLILEFVKEPTKAHRWIRIAAIATTGLNETLWACRVGRSREEQHHR
jgi:hypothetical protein